MKRRNWWNVSIIFPFPDDFSIHYSVTQMMNEAKMMSKKLSNDLKMNSTSGCIYTRNYPWLGQHQPNTSVRMVIGCVSTNSYVKWGRKNWQSENCACFISNFIRNIYLQYCTDIILLVTNNIITEKMNWQKQWNSGSDLYLLPIYFIIYNYDAKIPYCAIIGNLSYHAKE